MHYTCVIINGKLHVRRELNLYFVSLPLTAVDGGCKNHIASFPGLPTVQFLIACCMQKTGRWEGLGTRLESIWELHSLTDINSWYHAQASLSHMANNVNCERVGA